MSDLQLTRELPEELSYKFLKKERFAIGPWRSDGLYLYLDNSPFCFFKRAVPFIIAQKQGVLPHYSEPFYNSDFFKALILPVLEFFLFFFFF